MLWHLNWLCAAGSLPPTPHFWEPITGLAPILCLLGSDPLDLSLKQDTVIYQHQLKLSGICCPTQGSYKWPIWTTVATLGNDCLLISKTKQNKTHTSMLSFLDDPMLCWLMIWFPSRQGVGPKAQWEASLYPSMGPFCWLNQGQPCMNLQTHHLLSPQLLPQLPSPAWLLLPS